MAAALAAYCLDDHAASSSGGFEFDARDSRMTDARMTDEDRSDHCGAGLESDTFNPCSWQDEFAQLEAELQLEAPVSRASESALLNILATAANKKRLPTPAPPAFEAASGIRQCSVCREREEGAGRGNWG